MVGRMLWYRAGIVGNQRKPGGIVASWLNPGVFHACSGGDYEAGGVGERCGSQNAVVSCLHCEKQQKPVEHVVSG